MDWCGAAGFCTAAVAALRHRKLGVREKVLSVLAKFFDNLSDCFRRAAIAEVVAGKGVELLVCIIAVGGKDMLSLGLRMLQSFVKDFQARERMCAQGVTSQLIPCLAKWLLEVRYVVFWWVDSQEETKKGFTLCFSYMAPGEDC